MRENAHKNLLVGLIFALLAGVLMTLLNIFTPKSDDAVFATIFCTAVYGGISSIFILRGVKMLKKGR